VKFFSTDFFWQYSQTCRSVSMRSSDISNAVSAELALQSPKIVKRGNSDFKKKQQIFKKFKYFFYRCNREPAPTAGLHNMLHKIQPTKSTILNI